MQVGCRPSKATLIGDDIAQQVTIGILELHDLRKLSLAQVDRLARYQDKPLRVGLAVGVKRLNETRKALAGGPGGFEALSGFIQQVGQARLDQLEQQALLALDVVVQRPGA